MLSVCSSTSQLVAKRTEAGSELVLEVSIGEERAYLPICWFQYLYWSVVWVESYKA